MSRRRQIRILPYLLVAGVLGLGAVGAAVAADAAEPTMRARLAPVKPATRGTGTLTATAGSGQSVVVRWQLAVSNLTGPVRRATLQTPAPAKVTFSLCKPCSAKARGQIVLLRSTWNRILAGGATVVVTTRAHPAGELRGTLKRG
jgi:CHRD domain